MCEAQRTELTAKQTLRELKGESRDTSTLCLWPTSQVRRSPATRKTPQCRRPTAPRAFPEQTTEEHTLSSRAHGTYAGTDQLPAMAHFNACLKIEIVCFLTMSLIHELKLEVNMERPQETLQTLGE